MIKRPLSRRVTVYVTSKSAKIGIFMHFYFFFELTCERTFIKTHINESRFHHMTGQYTV